MQDDPLDQPMTKRDGEKLRHDLVKWMFIFWAVQITLVLYFRFMPDFCAFLNS